jgi:chromosome segregation ATPase
MLREHSLVEARPADPLQVLERAQALLEEQREELARWIADLQSVQHSLGENGNGDAQALVAENEELRARLRVLEEEEKTASRAPAPSRAPAADDKELEDLRAEIELQRQLLEQKDAVIADLYTKKNEAPDEAAAPAALPTAVPVAAAPRTPAEPRADIDPDSIEAELNEFRQQLQIDRQKLDAEIQQIKTRNEELDEATREMEMELSRERAELARERQRLERLRDDVKGDLERLQREGGVRDSLAPVQRLREEMGHKKPKPPEQAALNDRVNKFRHRLSE